MYVSVIVPTYNRCALLRETLAFLGRQSYPCSEYEVIVVDDGSTDGTGEMVKSLEVPYVLRYFWQPNKGRCAARNLGVSQAKGDIILFLDGDIVAAPGLLAEHVESHNQLQNVLVRGAIQLWPPLKTTPFTKYGLTALDQVDHLLHKDGYLPFSQALTGNLSIKKAHLTDLGPLDETFDQGNAWDDVDLGYRAYRLGLQLFYNPAAIGYHNDQVLTLEGQCQRVWRASRSVLILFDKYPELREVIVRYRDKSPISWSKDPPDLIARKIARGLLATSPLLSGLKLATRLLERLYPWPPLLRRCYWLIVGSYALRGYREALKGHAQ